MKIFNTFTHIAALAAAAVTSHQGDVANTVFFCFISFLTYCELRDAK